LNLILFSREEANGSLPRSDRRAEHILEVLRIGEGGSFDVGLINGPRGKATLRELGPCTLTLDFSWREEPAPLAPVDLVIGLPRPQTARKILLEACSLGVRSMSFVLSDRGEPGYAQSTLWSSDEWERLLIAGAEQAFCTRLPRIIHGVRLSECLQALPESAARIALDNYEGSSRMGDPSPLTPPVVLALGSERGWSDGERELLRKHGFSLVHLGPRVLRTETAVIASVALALGRLGRI